MLGWIRRQRARLKYRHFDDDLRRELAEHRELKEAELRAGGMPTAEARTAAARALGNVTLERERARGIWLAPWLESVWQDARYTVRSLRRSPGFALTGFLTLIVGIGLNTCFFSVANGLLLRPWPVPNPDEVILAFARREIARGRIDATGVSAVEYRHLRDHARTVRLVASRRGGLQLGTEPHAETVEMRAVSGNYFDVLGIQFLAGRGFSPEHDRHEQPIPVTILSSGLWRDRFAASAGIAGTTVRLNGVEFTVIGVADRDVTSSMIDGARPSVWVPLATFPLLNPEDTFSREFLVNAGHCCVDLAGRLRAGVSRSEAQAELTALDSQIRETRTGEPLGMVVRSTSPVSHPKGREFATVFLLVTIGLLMMLLVACANLGNLQLARAMARRRELAIRGSLGASRRRIVRQLLTEGLVLAGTAAAISLLASFVLPPVVLGALIPPEDMAGVVVTPDMQVIMIVVLLAALSIVVSGLAPALKSTHRLTMSRDQPMHHPLRLRSLLLALQVAFSIVLLFASALITRGIAHAAQSDPGFSIQGISHVEIQLPGASPRAETRQAVSDSVRTALQNAGIGDVALTNMVPLSGSASRTGARLPHQGEDANVMTDLQDVSPEFFSLLRIPLKDGRFFEATDPPTDVMINEMLAAALWPGERAVGRTFTGGRVIGVAGDARLIEMDQLDPTVFRRTTAQTNLLVRDRADVTDRVRAAAKAIAPGAVVTITPLEANLRESLRVATVGAAVATGIALVSLALATIGVVGVFSYIVDERKREIAIRMAIGAGARQVLSLIFRQATRSLAIGIVAGFLAALVAAPVLGSYLFGLSPRDPLAVLLTAAVLTVAAIGATWLPARRAVRIDPVIALKAE